jgi:hypothetical protein
MGTTVTVFLPDAPEPKSEPDAKAAAANRA